MDFPYFGTRKERKDRGHAHNLNRTGEDIDMLNEERSDPQSGKYGSEEYKDDIDSV